VNLRVAVLSVHTCPLAALGGKETGGMNVYVRESARALGRMGVEVDVYTRSQDPGIRRIVPLGEGARVIHLPAGPQRPMPREVVHQHLPEFVAGIEAFRESEDLAYDLIHAHYWLSGVAGLELRERWDTPVVQMFHTLGRLKNRVARADNEREPELRIGEETRIVGGVDRIVAANSVERAHLVWYYGAAAERIAVIPAAWIPSSSSPWGLPPPRGSSTFRPRRCSSTSAGSSPSRGWKPCSRPWRAWTGPRGSSSWAGTRTSPRTGTGSISAAAWPRWGSTPACASWAPSPRSASASSTRPPTRR
jgi:hypothetical protein